MDSAQWESQLRKGALEMVVLAALWRTPLYGLEIIRTVERELALALSEGTVYPILSRLRADNSLTAQWVEAEAGHPRKYYALTDAGRQRLLAMVNTWDEFSRGVNRLLKLVEQKDASQ